MGHCIICGAGLTGVLLPNLRYDPERAAAYRAEVGGADSSSSSAAGGDTVDRDLEEVSQQISRAVDAAKKNIPSARKRAPRSAARGVGKTPAQSGGPSSSSSSSLMDTGTVRRSTRKRTVRNLDMETPAAATGARGRGRVGPFATPAITPKFDITTPLNRSVMRLVKPDETLMSLNGSPVYAGQLASTARRRLSSIFHCNKSLCFHILSSFILSGGKRKKAETTPEMVAIPLANGKTMMVPLGEAAELPAAAQSAAKKPRGGKKARYTSHTPNSHVVFTCGDCRQVK